MTQDEMKARIEQLIDDLNCTIVVSVLGMEELDNNKAEPLLEAFAREMMVKGVEEVRDLVGDIDLDYFSPFYVDKQIDNAITQLQKGGEAS